MKPLARFGAGVLTLILSLSSMPAIGDAQNATAVPASTAATATGTVSGTLLDRDGGLPVSRATVSLYRGDTSVASTQSSAAGAFSFSGVDPGIYTIVFVATGYGAQRSDNVVVVSGSTVTIKTLVARSATASGNSLREIGRVSSAATVGNGSLATSTTITENLSTPVLQREGYTRVGDALNTLPGANITGLSSSVGDDLGVDIRGFGSDETQVLLDGHPIGPQGVGGSTFGFQVSPDYGIANTQVTYGSGALGLYGTDAIGGTVDMQTLNPTRQNHAQLTQGVGYEGRRFTDVLATGSVADGKLGFAIDHAVDGTYGPWPTQSRLQPGLLNGDFSPASLAANTYGTSGDYLLRSDLIKLKYSFSPKTSFEADEFDSSSFDDKSGNGDNCYFTYGEKLYTAQQAASTTQAYSYGNLQKTCLAGTYGVTYDQKTISCISPSQYAASTYGLAGGGPSPFQTHRFHDYHGRIQTSLGLNTLTIDGYGNRYSTDYNRQVATGSFDTQFYDTTGLLISDDIATQYNDVGFGYFVEHQNHLGTYVDGSLASTDPLFNRIQIGANSIPGQQFSFGIRNFFLRDQYTPPGPLSIYLNAFLKRNTLTDSQTFDPRLSFVLHATNRDVVRLTAGRSDGAPAPELLQGPPSLNTTYSNITPNCGGITPVGSTSNPGLQPEQSTDFEFGYGHRFGGDTVINADAYYSFEKNRIFGGVVPIASIPSVVIPATLLQDYFNRINSFCGTNNASASSLAFGTNFNAATARYQGIEANGRTRLNRQLFLDYTYDIQSAVNLGVPDQILQNNVTLINGSQIDGIPLQKYSAGLDFAQNGFEARVDGYYIGAFNGYNRDPFYYANASLTKTFGTGTTINVGVLNLFNSQASQLFVYGAAPLKGENAYGTDTTALQQASSQGIGQTGLLPITAVFSIQQRI